MTARFMQTMSKSSRIFRGLRRTIVTRVRVGAVSFAWLALPGMFGQTRPAPDIETWSELDLSGPIAPKLTVTVPVVVRNSASLENPQLFGVGPLFDLAVPKHLALTGGYLYVSLPNTGSGYGVHVPLAAVTLKTTVGRLKISDRNRAEGLIGLPHDPIRYRNKLILDIPFHSERWQPFLSDEVFYDFSKSAWTQNRFQVGLGRELSTRYRLDVFYMERNSRQGNPTASHIAGVTLQIKFTRATRRESVPHEEN